MTRRILAMLFVLRTRDVVNRLPTFKAWARCLGSGLRLALTPAPSQVIVLRSWATDGSVPTGGPRALLRALSRAIAGQSPAAIRFSLRSRAATSLARALSPTTVT